MNAARAVVSVLLLVVGAMLVAGPLGAADCLRPVGELPEGPALAVDMEGSLAAFGRGRVLVLADLTDPSDPVELGSVVLPGVVQSVELTATHAWVVAGPVGLIGVDVTDPSQPAIVSHLPAGLAGEDAIAVDVAADAGHVYLLEQPEGQPYRFSRLRVIDISDPGAPWDVGSFVSSEPPDAVAVAGDFVVMTDAFRLRVIDVSHPETPFTIGWTYLGSYTWTDALVASGSHAFVMTDNGLLSVDFTDPRNPLWETLLATAGCGTLALDGNLAVAGCPDPWSGLSGSGIRVFDVSDPAQPIELAFLETSQPVIGVAAGRGMALAAAGRAGLRVVELSEPSQPVEVAVLKARDTVEWVATQGSIALIGSSHQMTLVDVSDPAHPAARADLAVPFLATYHRPALEGSLAFVGSYRPPGIAVFDVSELGDPEQLTFLHLEDDPRGLDVNESRLYALAGPALAVIDVADPEFPAVVGEARAGEGGYTNLVAYDRGQVTVTNVPCPWADPSLCFWSLQLFDVARPDQPQLLDTLYHVAAVAIAPRGSFNFVAGEAGTVDGIIVVDVQVPTRLLAVAGLDLIGYPMSMVVDERVAYLTTRRSHYFHAVQAVSVWDPLHPSLMGEHPTPGQALDLALSGNTLFVADGDAGLLLLDATDCAFPPPRHPAGRLAPRQVTTRP